MITLNNEGLKHMSFFIIILIVGILLYAIIKSNRSQPIRENTHSYHVNLIKHQYRVSTITSESNTVLSKLAKNDTNHFLWFGPLDNMRRPSIAAVSWQSRDSVNWYDAKKQFKNRKKHRKSSIGSISDPIGWTQRYTTDIKPFELVSRGDQMHSQHLFERGHLIPYWISQDEITQKNLVPITQYTNKGFEGDDQSQLSFGSINSEAMLSIESEFRRFTLGKDWRSRLKPGDVFQMYVVPVYNDDNYVPIRINYYFRLITEKGTLRSFSFYGTDVHHQNVLKISVPVQMSDGTITKIIKAM